MIVYKIYNDVDDKIYIGITTRHLNERWNEHTSRIEERKHCHLYAAMLKYGKDKFHIVQIDDADSKEELYEKEKYYIALYNSNNPQFGYNMTDGGDSLRAIDLDENNIIKLYQEGFSTTYIAKELGVSESTIRRRLIKNNIKPDWHSSCKISTEDDKIIIELRKSGKTIKEISNIYNVSESTIRRHLYKYNMN